MITMEEDTPDEEALWAVRAETTIFLFSWWFRGAVVAFGIGHYWEPMMNSIWTLDYAWEFAQATTAPALSFGPALFALWILHPEWGLLMEELGRELKDLQRGLAALGREVTPADGGIKTPRPKARPQLRKKHGPGVLPGETPKEAGHRILLEAKFPHLLIRIYNKDRERLGFEPIPDPIHDKHETLRKPTPFKNRHAYFS